MARSFPNPFSRQTRIDYHVPSAGRVAISAFDVTGKRVRALFYGFLPAGDHSLVWDGNADSPTPMPAGLYFYHVVTQGLRR